MASAPKTGNRLDLIWLEGLGGSGGGLRSVLGVGQPARAQQRLPACCAANATRPAHLLSSPGLPHTAAERRLCSYWVRRSSRAVCRLRLRLRLFALPPPDAFGRCRRGHLRVGRCQLCGCRSGTELVVPFTGDNMEIVLSLPGDELLDDPKYSGFVIEVLQEGRNRWKRTEEEWYALGSYGHWKPYYSPEAATGALTKWSGHRVRFDERCGAEDDWLLWASNSDCEARPCTSITSGVVNSSVIASPGYPRYFQPGIDSCYRFSLSNESCAIEFTMEDFDLPSSPSCTEGYVQTEEGGQRYCGTSLLSKTWTSTAASVTVSVASTAVAPAGHRGFSLRYRQLPCCGGVISNSTFQLSSSVLPTGRNYSCSWTVVPATQDSCELQVDVEELRLPCGQAELRLGTVKLCGDRSGDSVRLQLGAEGVPVTFWRNATAGGAVFNITGRQAEDCDPFELDVPLQ
ncbi:uncharacterized protein LOC126263462 [Schistocerca nitens]|uniref:uncharacterized protein LOC126263462 n=1 Tax=Schistocerca nitens TaxID=7011 RepID=UPI002117DCAB|nr:uncharacterized protein LOC126263462 [Schistocerca nitens]